MGYKGSCRSCGGDMTVVAVCTVCKEDVFWQCDQCERIEDIWHGAHDYLETPLAPMIMR